MEAIRGSDGADTIIGSDVPNALLGRSGADYLHGMGGDDIITDSSGDNLIYGGEGHDWIEGSGFIYGGNGSDHISAIDTAYGEDGDDFLYALGAQTILIGGAGNDYLEGRDGGGYSLDKTTFIVGQDTDVVYGFGDLVLSSGTFEDAKFEKYANDSLVITSGDSVTIVKKYFEGFTTSEFSIQKISFDNGSTMDALPVNGIILNSSLLDNDLFSTFDDNLKGTLGNDVYYADNGGDEHIDSRGGLNTYIFDQNYNNTTVVNTSNELGLDLIEERIILNGVENVSDLYFTDEMGSHAHTLYYGAAGNVQIRTADFGASWDNFVFEVNGGTYVTEDIAYIRNGTSGDDRLNFYNNTNEAHFADVYHGGDGNDHILGRLGDDTLFGDAGDDYISGGIGNNVIFGGDGDDRLFGGEDDAEGDKIYRNVIYDGLGNDRLEGGGKHIDTFVITKEAGAIDTISRFNTYGHQGDVLNLSNFEGQFGDFSSIAQAMAQVGSNVEITLGEGQKIILENNTIANLNENYFTDELYTPILAPVAVDDSITIDIDAFDLGDYIGLYVLNNDQNLSDYTITLTIIDGAEYGDLLIKSDLSVEYQPYYDMAFSGVGDTDSFAYQIENEFGEISTASVSLTLGHPNSTPIAQSDTASTDKNQVLTITAAQLLSNDSDADNDTLVIQSVQSALNGQAALNSDGSVTFTADSDYVGAASFTYTVSDGQGGTATASVNITVNDVIDSGIIGTDGDDELFGTAGDDVISAQAGDDIVNAGSGADTVSGGNGDDQLNGGDDDDLLYGDNGDDFITGGRGNNEIYGGEDSDVLVGASNDDLVYGGADDDLLLGNNGDDTLFGGEGDDKIYGGRGDDILHFGEGNDLLYGGDGNDIFKAEATGTIESSTIRDFDKDTDKLDIADILTAYDPLADALTDFVSIEASRSRATVFVDLDGAGTDHAWEQLVEMQVKGVSDLSTDLDQLLSDGVLVV
jgi:Ca2+-binding RTX toxin-like protein